MPRAEPPLRWFFFLSSLSAIAPLSTDMYLPSFPSITQNLGAAPGAVQFTLASFFIGLAVGQAFYGPLSDRFGRKPPLYAGMILYTLASIACTFATSIESLVFWRFIQAVGGCAGMVVPRAIVRDHFEAQGSAHAFSMLMMIIGVAPILAPIFGGWILHIGGWRSIFAVLIIYGLVNLATIRFGLEETHPADPSRPLHLGQTICSYAKLCLDRHFIGYTLTGGMAQAGLFAYISGSPFVIISLWHVPAEHFGWIFGCNAMCFIAASQINVRLLRRVSVEKILRGAVCATTGFGLLLVAIGALNKGGAALFLPVLACYMLSLGFIGPNSAACALAKQGQQAGLASALMGSLQFGLATLVSSAIGLVHAQTALPMTLMMAACAGSSFIIHRLLVARANSCMP